LRDRRARLRPAEVGLAAGNGRRRVAGLRREEVATLAGVGVTWYTMLENGSADGVSLATLDALAGALHLSPGERGYLLSLADQTEVEQPCPQAGELALGALAAIEWAPAYVCTTQWTVLAWNAAMSFVWEIEAPGGPPFNIVQRMFADPAIRALHGTRFPAFARALVAMVRSGAGRRADDPVYRAIYEGLHDDAIFAAAWDAYDVAAPQGSVRTTIDSPRAGEFAYDALTLPIPDDAGHSLVVQVPDGPSAARLRRVLRD
jgi:transcriptional regulator with XRE-family HTH domain